MLGIGVVEVLQVRSPWRHLLATAPVLKVLAVFMAVCSVRLVRDLPVYQLDAVRDSSIWYYGIFAFLVAAAAVREPTFVPRLLRWYRQVLPWYFLWAPIALVLAQVDGLAGISVPGTGTPINSFRFNDIAVHLGLGLAFLWLGVDRLIERESTSAARDAWLSIVGVLALLVAASQSRGGFLAALGTAAIAFAYLPAGRRRRLVFSVTAGLLVVLTVVWTLDLRLQGERRDVSLQQLTANLASIAGSTDNEELSGTVQWREGFWQQVLNDLLSSQAWLNGIGFGPILPDRYEVDVGNTNNDPNAQPLRSVHNSHLTILARVGFPGFGLWVLLWLTFGVQLVRWVRRRPGGVRDPAAALGVWYLASVAGVPDRRLLRSLARGPPRRHLAVHPGGARRRPQQGRRGPASERAAPALWPTAVSGPPGGHLAGGHVGACPAPRRAARLGRGRPGDVQPDQLRGEHLRGPDPGDRGVRGLQPGLRHLPDRARRVARGWPPTRWPCGTAAWSPDGGAGPWPAPAGTAIAVGLIAGAGCLIAGLCVRRVDRRGPAGARADPARPAAPGQLALRVLLSREGPEAFVNDLAWALALVPAMAGHGGERACLGRLVHARLGRVGLFRRGRRRVPGPAGPAGHRGGPVAAQHRDLASATWVRASA